MNAARLWQRSHVPNSFINFKLFLRGAMEPELGLAPAAGANPCRPSQQAAESCETHIALFESEERLMWGHQKLVPASGSD